MLNRDSGTALLLAHEHARRLREEWAADRPRPASAIRRDLAASLRRAADCFDPAPLVHRAV